MLRSAMLALAIFGSIGAVSLTTSEAFASEGAPRVQYAKYRGGHHSRRTVVVYRPYRYYHPYYYRPAPFFFPFWW